MGTFFERLTPDCVQSAAPLIKEFIDTKSERKHESFEKCIGRLINTIGVDFILSVYPIKIEGNPYDESYQETTNLWLLPLILKYGKS